LKSEQLGPCFQGRRGRDITGQIPARGGVGGGGGLAHEHQELKARLGVSLGGRGGDRRWGSYGGPKRRRRGACQREVPGEEGGQVLVQQLQQEERKLLGWLDRLEEGRKDGFDRNRSSPARR
jgi:hypothetical protein